MAGWKGRVANRLKLIPLLQTVYTHMRGGSDENLAGLQALAISAMLHRKAEPADVRARAVQNPRYRRAEPETYEVYLARLRELEPGAFPLWFGVFERGAHEYAEAPAGSCSMWGHRYAEAFRDFCTFHLRGRVLDIGCGPVGKPVYIVDYPSSHVSAIEPIPLWKSVDFEVVRGFAEFLPWPDGAFECVIVATSLDHVLSLDRSLAEMHRVLAPEGCALVWVGSVPGAPPYDPKSPSLKAIDSYHLFHFDKAWFEPVISDLFQIEDKLEFPGITASNVFYRLVKRERGKTLGQTA